MPAILVSASPLRHRGSPPPPPPLPALHAAVAGHYHGGSSQDAHHPKEEEGSTPHLIEHLLKQDSSQAYLSAGPWEWLPVMYAADRGDVRSVQMLLQHAGGGGGRGAARQVEAVDSMGDTCLHIAASRGYEDVVSLLLDYHAPLHAQDSWGSTPLALASSNGHLPVVLRLLQAAQRMNKEEEVEGGGGGKVGGKRGRGWEGLKDMVFSRWRPRPRLGEEGDGGGGSNAGRQINYHDEKGQEGREEEEKEHDLVNHHGRSPLWRACCEGHVEVAHTLLAGGCDPFLNDDQGVSPRAVAEEKGHAAVVALIDEWTKTTTPPAVARRLLRQAGGRPLPCCLSLNEG